MPPRKPPPPHVVHAAGRRHGTVAAGTAPPPKLPRRAVLGGSRVPPPCAGVPLALAHRVADAVLVLPQQLVGERDGRLAVVAVVVVIVVVIVLLAWPSVNGRRLQPVCVAVEWLRVPRRRRDRRRRIGTWRHIAGLHVVRRGGGRRPTGLRPELAVRRAEW